MTEFEILTLCVSLAAITVSCIVAIFATRASYEVSSSDYRAEQQVKSDTAVLLSTLRSIMHKSGILIAREDSVDISYETKMISNFLTSETGLAYSAWVNERSVNAHEEGRSGEIWRLFFLYLAELSVMTDPYSAAHRAADIELLFDELTEEDIKRIAAFNSDLVKTIAGMSENRDGNVLAAIFVGKSRDMLTQREQLPDKLQYLKKLGIKDPDIDLFLALYSEDRDVGAVEAALEAGANVNMTDGALLNKYGEQLKGYPNSEQRDGSCLPTNGVETKFRQPEITSERKKLFFWAGWQIGNKLLLSPIKPISGEIRIKYLLDCLDILNIADSKMYQDMHRFTQMGESISETTEEEKSELFFETFFRTLDSMSKTILEKSSDHERAWFLLGRLLHELPCLLVLGKEETDEDFRSIEKAQSIIVESPSIPDSIKGMVVDLMNTTRDSREANLVFEQSNELYQTVLQAEPFGS